MIEYLLIILLIISNDIVTGFCGSDLTGDVPRVNGQLAVSRAFGDKGLKTHLSSEPDIKEAVVDSQTDVLLLASDGIWKVMAYSLYILQYKSILLSNETIHLLLTNCFETIFSDCLNDVNR